MYKTVAYTVKTWIFTKRGSQKVLLLTVAVQFLKISQNLQKNTNNGVSL